LDFLESETAQFFPAIKNLSSQSSFIMSDMDEDYGFEYSDEEQDEEQVDVENQYYNAKGASLALFFFSVVFFIHCRRSLFSSFEI